MRIFKFILLLLFKNFVEIMKIQQNLENFKYL